MIRSVNIIGYGNVGKFLSGHLSAQGLSVKVYQRSGAEVGEKFVGSISDLPNADLTIICVKDDEINSVSDQILVNGIVTHTSGSVNMSALASHSNHGVFYPLQTISKNRKVEADEIPFLIEANSDKTKDDLTLFAQNYFSDNVQYCSSEKREKIHLAAVMVNNFVNHLIHQADDFLSSEGQSIDLLQPLLKETIAKANEEGALNAQTGPAKRGDQDTINKHLSLLKDDKLRELYALFSKMISEAFNA